jgi:hypothetical protein
MMTSLERCFGPLLMLVIASACTTGGDAAGKTEDPKTENPKPEYPKPPATTTISVASVQMIQDCPDEEPEPSNQATLAEERAAPSAAMPPSPGAPAHPGDSIGSFRQPCDQSSIQLALENKGDAPVAVQIEAVRILSKGKVVGTIESRRPKIWANNAYEAWDQTAAPGSPIKVSYKLAMPDWSKVEEAIGQSSFGYMFTLEIDVVIDGQVQTVSSAEFPREEPHVIVT